MSEQKRKPRTKLTIDMILGQQTVKDMIDDLVEKAEDIEGLFILVTKRGDDNFHWHRNMTDSYLIYAMECVKSHIINGKVEDVDE